MTTHPADEAFQLVVAQSGATKPVRDAITTWVAQSVIDGTGSWHAGRLAPRRRLPHLHPAKAPADTNANGIPDAWELAHGLDLAKSKATGRDLDPHYDNIEVYLNSL